MLSIIFHDVSDVSENIISNWETVLERQVRLIENCGVRDFCVFGIDASASDRLKKKIRSNTHLRFEDDIDTLVKIVRDSNVPILFLQSNLVFSEKIIKSVAESDNEALTVIAKELEHSLSDMRAQIDMKRVVQIDPSLKGPGCWPHFPIYKLNSTLCEKMIIAIKNGANSTAAAMHQLLSEIDLNFIDCTKNTGYISIVKDEEIDTVRNSVDFYAFKEQVKHLSASSIMNIPEILNDADATNPLVICDEHYEALPISEYFDYINLKYNTLKVSALPEENEILKGVEHIVHDRCDAIISLGQATTIDAGKAVMQYLLKVKDCVAMNHIIHIAVPAVADFGSEATRLSTVYRNGKIVKTFDTCPLPDFAIIDINLYKALLNKQEMIQQRQQANEVDSFDEESDEYSLNDFFAENNRDKKKAKEEDQDDLEPRDNIDMSRSDDTEKQDDSSDALASDNEDELDYSQRHKQLKSVLPRYFKKNGPRNLILAAHFTGRAVSFSTDEISYGIGKILSEHLHIPIGRAVAYSLPFVIDSYNLMLNKFNEHDAALGEDEKIEPDEQIKRIQRIFLQLRQNLGIKTCSSIKRLMLTIYDLLELKYPSIDDEQVIDELINRAEKELGPYKYMPVEILRETLLQILSFNSEEYLESTDTLMGDALSQENNAAQAKPAKKKLSKKARRTRNKKIILKIIRRIPFAYKPFIYLLRKGRFLYYRRKFGVNYRAVVFDSFAGRGYRCNPKALYEQMLQDGAYSDFTFIWAFRNPKKYQFLKRNPNTRVVKRHSKQYVKACATSKYWIANAVLPSYIKPSKEQVNIQTWHGKPLKKIGCDFHGDTPNHKAKTRQKLFFVKPGKQFSKLLSPAPVFSEKMRAAFNIDKDKAKNVLVETGYPRNDYLFKFSENDVVSIKLRLGIPLNKKVLLFAPTWRPKNNYKESYEYNSSVDFSDLQNQLGDDFVILFRAHINEAKTVDFSLYSHFIFDVTKEEDINELYVVSDLLITDYSGAIFDYANLRRPIIYYMYDREAYEENPGVYFDLNELPGHIVYTQNELSNAIVESIKTFKYDSKYISFNEKYNALDGPECSIYTLDRIIDLSSTQTKSKNRSIKASKRFRRLYIKTGAFFRKKGILISKNSNELKTYENKHDNERCFLIGNGPSLSLSDIQKLDNEITFGCNMIYKVFQDTNWRPTYYCISDRIFLKSISTITSHFENKIFMPHSLYSKMPIKPNNILYVYNIIEDPYRVMDNLIGYYSPSFATVMSFMLEMAMFMGFSEIYLLGVDCTNPHAPKGHFVDDYRDKTVETSESRRARRVVDGKPMNIVEFGEWMVERQQNTYAIISEYAEKNGYKIYNATRGGELRSFERADLDIVLKKG